MAEVYIASEEERRAYQAGRITPLTSQFARWLGEYHPEAVDFYGQMQAAYYEGGGYSAESLQSLQELQSEYQAYKEAQLGGSAWVRARRFLVPILGGVAAGVARRASAPEFTGVIDRTAQQVASTPAEALRLGAQEVNVPAETRSRLAVVGDWMGALFGGYESTARTGEVAGVTESGAWDWGAFVGGLLALGGGAAAGAGALAGRATTEIGDIGEQSLESVTALIDPWNRYLADWVFGRRPGVETQTLPASSGPAVVGGGGIDWNQVAMYAYYGG